MKSRVDLRKAVKSGSTIDEVLQITTNFIEELKTEDPSIKIAYIAGKVTADGKENINKNLNRLHRYARNLSNNFLGFVFSAADVFNNEIYWKLNLAQPLHEEDFYKFWRKIVGSGVTDIYMTPEWQKSTGASDEYIIAKKLGISIHYF